MKKTILVASILALVAGPALAASTTVEFTGEDGAVQVWKFSDDGTASGPEDASATYTWDEEAKKLCATFAGDEPQTVCATFEDNGGDGSVGETAGYTLDDGRKGTAKIIAKEE